MIARTRLLDHIRAAPARSPVLVLTGPRQAGKTTLIESLPIAGRTIPGRMEREDTPLLPVEALREALANAFVHRDYAIGGGSVSVAIYDDRLEIISNGDLRFGLTPEAPSREHESRPWNPMIARTFLPARHRDLGARDSEDRPADAGSGAPASRGGTVVVTFMASVTGAPETPVKTTGKRRGKPRRMCSICFAIGQSCLRPSWPSGSGSQKGPSSVPSRSCGKRVVWSGLARPSCPPGRPSEPPGAPAGPSCSPRASLNPSRGRDRLPARSHSSRPGMPDSSDSMRPPHRPRSVVAPRPGAKPGNID